MKTVDIRNIDPTYFHPWRDYTNEKVEWFKKPTQFKHFKNRINLLHDGLVAEPLYKEKRDFEDFLKYKILNLIPTKNKELTEEIYDYLNLKYGKDGLNRILRKCARYRLERDKHG